MRKWKYKRKVEKLQSYKIINVKLLQDISAWNLKNATNIERV